MNWSRMRPIYVVVAIAGIVIVILLTQGKGTTSDAIIGNEILVSEYTKGGFATGRVLIQVPFLRSLGESESLSILIDKNSDGTVSDDEALITDVPLRAQADWRSGYYAVLDTPIAEGSAARIVIDNVAYESTVRLKRIEAIQQSDLVSITDPVNAMKGGAISVAHAQSEPVEITQEGVPDLTQRIAECAPTAAANSLISLININGGENLIPGDPLDFIENLKMHMNWTPENGVLPDDFVEGKNRWAAAAGVPIRTVKVGDVNGTSTVDAIRDALRSGDAVELRITFADAQLEAVGGHMVTVVGIHQAEGQTYLDINDPKTADSGTETVEIRGNQIVNYGPWEGITVLSWGFVQTWEGHPTGSLLDPMTDEEIRGIREFVGDPPTVAVIEYSGNYLPVSELVVENETGCGAEHWHAAKGTVTATDGTVVADPGPQCGFGKVSEVPSIMIPVSPVHRNGEIEVRGLESLKTH